MDEVNIYMIIKILYLSHFNFIPFSNISLEFHLVPDKIKITHMHDNQPNNSFTKLFNQQHEFI